MPRGTTHFNAQMVSAEVSPVLLVRLLDIPEIADPSTTHSLYLTDCEEDPVTGSTTEVDYFDEDGDAQVYTPCGLAFESVSMSKETEVPTARITMDNVPRAFSALAQYAKLNGVRVHVLRAFRETLKHTDGAQTLFIGHLKKVTIGEYSISADVWADFSLKRRCPRRLYWSNLFPYLPSTKDPRNVEVGGIAGTEGKQYTPREQDFMDTCLASGKTVSVCEAELRADQETRFAIWDDGIDER